MTAPKVKAATTFVAIVDSGNENAKRSIKPKKAYQGSECHSPKQPMITDPSRILAPPRTLRGHPLIVPRA